MDKRALLDQLVDRLRESLRVAESQRDAAAEEARSGATPAEKRDDARVALEWSNMARAQGRRAAQTKSDLQALESFALRSFAKNAAIDVGAIVEVEHEEGGVTFFLAPAGAGEELSGPGGDGFLTVVTPSSPLGRAVVGKRVGDSVEARIAGELREWTITWVE
jgi:transcription elongation GreA/GreB family factor